MNRLHSWLLLCNVVDIVTPARILLLPFSFSSHVSELSHIGRHLLDRNHDVHMLLSPSLPDIERFKVNLFYLFVNISEYHAVYLEMTKNSEQTNWTD